MRYESAKTERGNVGVSYISQKLADAQAAKMDKGGNNDCTGCTNCHDCHDCTNCHDCNYCTNCHDCNYCTNCHDCNYCTNCYDCHDCTKCTGIIKWCGEAACSLIAINGLKWPIATDGKKIQIGCQLHTMEEWTAFSDAEIARMDYAALEWWHQFKPTVMAMADCRKLLGD